MDNLLPVNGKRTSQLSLSQSVNMDDIGKPPVYRAHISVNLSATVPMEEDMMTPKEPRKAWVENTERRVKHDVVSTSLQLSERPLIDQAHSMHMFEFIGVNDPQANWRGVYMRSQYTNLDPEDTTPVNDEVKKSNS